MNTTSLVAALLVLACGVPLSAQENRSGDSTAAQRDAWTRAIKDRTERGTLQDAIQNVRGDSGKWRDEPELQHAPPIGQKPPKMALDDWADQLLEKKRPALTPRDDNWLIFRTRQLDDNDRLWIETIERRGNQFTVVLSEAIWQGRYQKTFTYYGVFGVNLGQLEAGKYEARWIVKPLVFKQFDGDGRPVVFKQSDGNSRPIDNWPKDEQSATDKKPVELSVTFTVVPDASPKN